MLVLPVTSNNNIDIVISDLSTVNNKYLQPKRIVNVFLFFLGEIVTTFC